MSGILLILEDDPVAAKLVALQAIEFGLTPRVARTIGEAGDVLSEMADTARTLAGAVLDYRVPAGARAMSTVPLDSSPLIESLGALHVRRVIYSGHMFAENEIAGCEAIRKGEPDTNQRLREWLRETADLARRGGETA